MHLHVHTHYSLLDGATRIEPMVERAKSLDMPAVAITDHGNMFGVIEFYHAAVAAGVKPIIGCEAYIAPGDRRMKQGSRIKDASYHLLLLAMNNDGYQNLMKLASIGYLEGFYYRPRIDMETLAAHSTGLLCTSTCLGAEIPQALLRHDRKRAEEVAEAYLKIFGADRFFIELQDHGMAEQRMINPELIDIATRLGVPVIATNDVHYLDHDDAEAHDVLCCISTRNLVTDEDRLKFPTDQFYFKTPDEMAALFESYPDAIANTLRVADLCNVDLDFKTRHAPVYRLPDERDENQYLRELVYDGANRKYGRVSDEIRERIDYELGVITEKGFSGYFLIVWDFMTYARSRGIPCAARGSGCSAVVSFCLDISMPDPLRYGLYFERFMDPDRDEMPDIDVDICQNGRAEVIEYVRRKYGHVANIITFGTLKAKAAVKDVSRVLGMGFKEANELTNLIPAELNVTIERAMELEPELRQRYETDGEVRRIIDIAKRVEGLSRHAGVHAAGVVVADTALDEFLPLYKSPSVEQIVTQYDGPTVERVGLLKFDLLGLRTLTTIARTRELVERATGETIDMDRLDLTDPRVYELFARGETRGIFQFESGGMRDVVMRMKPNRIEDLIAANALFRPGPMQYIDAYIARKHGEPWKTPHPIMTEVLSETYGIMVYQEQVSRLVNRLGGIELKRAFRLAKAISKKKTSMIEAERAPFYEGCARNGVSRDAAEHVFEDILKFGGYAFNKAHSTGYALIAHQTAWLKAYYPVEFMSALLTFEMGNTGKVVEYIDECRKMGIEVLPPDVNASNNDFTVDRTGVGGEARSAIRFGLCAVKGFGEKAAAAIRAARDDGGPFDSLFDFCERVDLTACGRSAVEPLINSGAFDSTGAMRKALTLVLDAAIDAGGKAQSDKRSGQMGLFGGDAAAKPVELKLPTGEWTEAEMLAREKAALGFYITRHPLVNAGPLIESCATSRTVDLGSLPEGTSVVLGGLVTASRSVMTRTQKKMSLITLEDLTGTVEAIVFPNDVPRFTAMLKPDAVVFLCGEVDRKREEPSLRVTDVIPAADAARSLGRNIVIEIPATDGEGSDILPALRELFRGYPGEQMPHLRFRLDDGICVTMRCSRGIGILFDERLQTELVRLIPPEHISVLSALNRPIPWTPPVEPVGAGSVRNVPTRRAVALTA